MLALKLPPVRTTNYNENYVKITVIRFRPSPNFDDFRDSCAGNKGIQSTVTYGKADHSRTRMNRASGVGFVRNQSETTEGAIIFPNVLR